MDDDMDDDIPQLEDTGTKHDITYETMVQSTNELGPLGSLGLVVSSQYDLVDDEMNFDC